jgi:hypothetical protein
MLFPWAWDTVGSNLEPLPPIVSKWKKLYSTPLLAIPTCVGFGVHQDKYR